jgi:hypothetical protein
LVRVVIADGENGVTAQELLAAGGGDVPIAVEFDN